MKLTQNQGVPWEITAAAWETVAKTTISPLSLVMKLCQTPFLHNKHFNIPFNMIIPTYIGRLIVLFTWVYNISQVFYIQTIQHERIYKNESKQSQ